MRHLLLLALMLLSSITMTAQDGGQDDLKNSKLTIQRPSFPGGQEALRKFLNSNMNYPASARKKGIQGRVVVGFSVETDGTLTDILILHSVDPDLDEEALRVVKCMPKWIPGEYDGKPIKSNYVFPLNFGLVNSIVESKITNDNQLRNMVIFEKDRSTINKSQSASIRSVAKYLNNHPEDTVIIRGYTRMVGDPQRNQKLSEIRANLIKKVLVKRHNIDANRLIAIGMGATNEFDSRGNLNDVVLFYLKKEESDSLR